MGPEAYRRHLNEEDEPDLQTIASDWRSVIEQATAPQVAQRFATAEEFLRALTTL
jgi:hypothetical protein